MRVGTKSVLFGAHCFFLHPWFVLAAWIRLYGFPWDPRIWVAAFVHDIGYCGKSGMDTPEGETHVELGAWIMSVFDKRFWRSRDKPPQYWENFTKYHSRFYAKRDGVTPSRLCLADKLAICLTPWWLYLPMVNLTGEIHEYMALAAARNLAGEPSGKYASMNMSTISQRDWHRAMVAYIEKWVEEFKDGRPDTWTPDMSRGCSYDATTQAL